MSVDEIQKSPPPSEDNGVTQQPPPAVAEPEADVAEAMKQQLAESMRSGTLEEPLEAPGTVKPVPPSPEPEAPAAPVPPKADTPPPAPAPVVDPAEAFDLPDDLRPDEIDPKFTKIRGRIEKMQASMRDTRKELAEHKKLRETAKLAGFDDGAYEDWVLLGTRANLGDVAAIRELNRRVRASGVPLEDAPPAPPAPVVPQISDADAIYQKHFKPRVDAFQMDEAAARDAAKDLAAGLRPATPSPAPPPALSHPHTQVPQTRPPVVDSIKSRVEAHMEQKDAEYAKTVPNWVAVKAEADRLVLADVAAGKRLDPVMWPADWDQKVRIAQMAVVKKQQAAAQPAVRVADTSLRPSRGGGSPPTNGKLTNDERRAAIAAAMSSGNLDNLPE